MIKSSNQIRNEMKKASKALSKGEITTKDASRLLSMMDDLRKAEEREIYERQDQRERWCFGR